MLRSPLRAHIGVLSVSVLGAALAHAQQLDVQQFHPAATSSSYFGLDSPSVVPHLRGAAGLVFSYGHQPLVLRGTDGAELAGGHLVAHQAWLEALGSVGLFDRFEIGLALPVALSQRGEDAPPGRDPAAALRGERGAALGDLRLDLKLLALDRVFGKEARPALVGVPAAATGHRLRLALVVGVSAPTSTTALAGEHNATGRPRLVFEWAYRRLRLAISLGAILRERASTLGLDVTHQLTWGLGVRAIVWRNLEVQAEARGAVGVAPPRGAIIASVEAPAELDVGLAYTLALGLRIFAAGGLGLGHGYGTPTARFLLGARYTLPESRREQSWNDADPDHDGLPNRIDRCVNEAGPAANEGCPDGDFDGDGVLDRFDRCPERAGLTDNAGCPDYDTDGDNIPDRIDRCPGEAGSALAFGCPVKDADKDGVPDAADRCPEQAGVAANDGCPEVDSDGDGWVDRADKCPFDAEVYNGTDDEDGCPDPGAALAGLVPGQVAIFEPIVFEKVGSAERLSARSLQVIAAIGHLLEAHRELERLRIGGHTDDRGSAITNLDLSLARAQLVRRRLVEVHRIDARRLTAQGFGGNRPLVDNTRPEGRARNRRIEITILDAPH